MARDTDGTGATDRLNIDGNLLDTDRWVWAVTGPDGEIRLYQEDPNSSIEPGREVLLHYDNAEDRPLSIGVYDERTTYDESVGREVTFGTYPVTDPATGEEFELWDELPDDGHDSITPLKLVN
jgi:hypothetical protein